jgi:valyl-tRNA synthetase
LSACAAKRALWVPGTDHAAIATQVKVEQLLMKEGFKDPRKELGREKFLERVIAFADDSANTIRTQVKKMGSSVVIGHAKPIPLMMSAMRR